MTKKIFSFTFLLITFCFITAQTSTDLESTNQVTNTVTQTGISLGSVIAVVTSWDRNKSLLWAIIHGILGWLYVIYFAVTDFSKK
ncbi:hypothetical protein IX39_04595 [Chryseobacterium formosense]|uniref:Uncharacterized protein n=1 Tax=Chryseobacterium formosense TaxID=236814 RepID=A0A085Z669_9FLAO|nr:hypothetical protein [Chryseobacterium formosense]KFE99932.1 hypothetical protein IX39_04595 [Chryseobacterium formosense]SFT60196.1 hypothetical protein SAMN05421857_2002 [Chryseobacterium formosense]